MKIKLKKYQRVYSFDYDNTLIDYKYTYDDDGDIEDVTYHGPNSDNVNKFKKLKQRLKKNQKLSQRKMQKFLKFLMRLRDKTSCLN